MNAPYYGGYAPGNQLFAVDGDFTSCDPCGMPVMSFPVKGDSILAQNDIVIFYPEVPTFATVSLGTYPNIHPWNPNQQVMVLEQEFIVAQNAYFPMPLNTPYNDILWSLGFQNTFPSGYPSASIGLMYLVEEGELQDIGGGLSKIRRKWATLPPVRCELEQYAYTFIGLSTNGSVQRPQYTQNVQSRIQYDYFIFDDLDVLNIPLFTDGGNRLNSTTGLYPTGLIIPQMQYFANPTIETAYGIYVGTPVDTLTDGDPTDPTTATLPSATDYLGWCTGISTGNGQTAEIVAESSTFTRWLGNIWERRTRFVLAQ